MQENTIDSMM